MVTININGETYQVNDKKNLLESCLSLGFDIPYFCWHPILGSVGSCRQCAVKKFENIKDTAGKIIMSCMTPSSDGLIISINDQEVEKFRKNIIEFLMINHPHDCPVCVEGGQCHLQDMTVMTKHYSRRYIFTKRTHYNQELGPFISHEMNRCITCYRCVRYYKDYADGKDFGVYGTHDNIYFGRNKNGMLENEFSGNLVEICPTGVFTDKIYSKNFNRKWDIQYSASICQQCSLGCNIILNSRNNKICRIENRYHNDINHYLLCDRGRFGYEYLNTNERPKTPLEKIENHWKILDIKNVIKKITKLVNNKITVIGIGSPRASIESNYKLQELVGKKNFSTGIPNKEYECLKLILKILKYSGIYTPSLREIEKYDAILILGEDVTNTNPRLALSIRQAIKNKNINIGKTKNIDSWNSSSIQYLKKNRYPLFITHFDKTSLSDVATWNYYAPIQDQARLAFGIANEINNISPKVYNLKNNIQHHIKIISKILLKSKKPLIISGTHSYDLSIIQASFNIVKALKSRNIINASISFMVSNVNSIGIMMLKGTSLEKILDDVSKKNNTVVIILENDIYRYVSNKKIEKAFNKKTSLIVIDHQNTKIINKADFILPAANFAESNGTVINQEGRAQRFFKVHNPFSKKIKILESWRWLDILYNSLKNNKFIWNTFDNVINNIINDFKKLSFLKKLAPSSNFKVHGQKLSRLPNRFSGRNSKNFNDNFEKYYNLQDKDTMFNFSMEGSSGTKTYQPYVPFVWHPGWNSPQAWNKFQLEINTSSLYGDSGIHIFSKIKEKKIEYFKCILNNFKKIKEKWVIVPYYHLFGTEEMTQLSESIKKIIPDPYIIMNIFDVKKLNFNATSKIKITVNEIPLCLKLIVSKILHSGQVGLPIGMSNIPTFLLGKYISHFQKVDINDN